VLNISPKRTLSEKSLHHLGMLLRYRFVIIVNYYPIASSTLPSSYCPEILFKPGNKLLKRLFIHRQGGARWVKMNFVYTFREQSSKSPIGYMLCDILNKCLPLRKGQVNIIRRLSEILATGHFKG